MLLPLDLRDWVHDDDLVNFVLEAVEHVDLSRFHLKNTRSGKDQYPPHMMLALLIYSYCLGLFSSRKIESATYRDIYVRYLTGNTHPDHDTICTFRRKNFDAISDCFLQVLLLAKELKLLKLGTVAVDGSHFKANASKDKNVTYKRAQELEQQLKGDIALLLKQAEQADQKSQSNEGLPDELKRREQLKSKMQEAQKKLEDRAQARAEAERPAFEKKQKAHEQRGGRGRAPKPPKEAPGDEEQCNLTDSDSRIMRKHKQGTTQSYNAQICVDSEGSQLILSNHLSQCSADTNELEPSLKGIANEVGKPEKVTADCGYCKVEALEALQTQGYDLYVSTKNEASQNKRVYEYRPASMSEKEARKLVDPVLLDMRAKLETEAGREIYSKRQSSVEPVFGIIKQAMGFRQFLLRGFEKVQGEWDLVCLAYNVKRIFNLKTQL